MSQQVALAGGTVTGRPAVAPRCSGLWTAVAAVVCAALGVAVLAGAMALDLPALAPVVTGLVLLAPLLLVRPVEFLILITVADAANLSEVGALNGLPRGESVLLLLAVIAAVVAVVRGQVRLAGSPFLAAAVLYLVFEAVATLAGVNVGTSVAATAATGKALLWPVMVGLLLLSRDRAPGAVARAFALTLALLSALTLVQEFLLHDATTFAGLSNVPVAVDLGGATARHSGPQTDPNFWGRVLVLGLPFALSLAKMASSLTRRWLWVGAALLICGGVVLTGSRGTLLATFAVFVVWAILTGGWALRALAAAPFIAGGLLLLPGVGSRLLTLQTIGAGSGLTIGDPSLEGRVAAQKVAFQMFLDHPVFGVGPGNFISIVPHYLRRLGINAPVLAPHNLYLEAAAEGGVLGLMGWLLLFGAAVFVALRARTLARTGGAAVEGVAPQALSNAVVAALSGWAVASIFLHMATFRTFLLVAAVGAALDIRARRRVAQLAAEGRFLPVRVVSVRGRPVRRGARARLVLAGLTAAMVLAAGVMWTMPAADASHWSATTDIKMVIDYTHTAESPAYDLDVLSRTGLVRTFGEIATLPRFVEEGRARVARIGGRTDGVTVHVSGSLLTSVILVTANAPDRKRGTDMAFAVRDSIIDYLNSISPLYRAGPTAGPPVVSRQPGSTFDHRLAFVPLTLAGGMVLTLVVMVAADAARRRRSRGGSDGPAPS